FGGNNFSGDIPACIGNLTGLTSLLLYQNLFNASRLPPEIGNLTRLETLGLAYNDQLDFPEIPFEFGRLNSLKVIWMTASNLAGRIPDSFANLAKWSKGLYCSSSSLKGKEGSPILASASAKWLLLLLMKTALLKLKQEEQEQEEQEHGDGVTSSFLKKVKVKVMDIQITSLAYFGQR
nr:receptor-like protein kinase HSL1 [Tanacetum cinerariifolium]